MVYVDVILSLQGRTKEILYITLNGKFLLKVRLGHFNLDIPLSVLVFFTDANCVNDVA